jgi:hypothetical protein
VVFEVLIEGGTGGEEEEEEEEEEERLVLQTYLLIERMRGGGGFGSEAYEAESAKVALQTCLHKLKTRRSPSFCS